MAGGVAFVPVFHTAFGRLTVLQKNHLRMVLFYAVTRMRQIAGITAASDADFSIGGLVSQKGHKEVLVCLLI